MNFVVFCEEHNLEKISFSIRERSAAFFFISMIGKITSLYVFILV